MLNIMVEFYIGVKKEKDFIERVGKLLNFYNIAIVNEQEEETFHLFTCCGMASDEDKLLLYLKEVPDINCIYKRKYS